MADDDGLTADEKKVYDRAIRTLGITVQGRLRNAGVLVAGLGGLGVEVAKNLALAGVGELTLYDPTVIGSVDDIPREAGHVLQYDEWRGPVARSELALAGVRSLNPLVTVSDAAGGSGPLSVEGVTKAVQGAAAGGKLRVVLLLDTVYHGLTADEVSAVNEATRALGVSFFAGAADGWSGHFFADCGESFVTGVDGTTFTQSFVPYRTAVTSQLSDARRFEVPEYGHAVVAKRDVATPALAPVCGVVGGILGQEVVKAATLGDPVVNNWFVYDGAGSGAGLVLAATGGVVETAAAARP
jgi:molybdopterin/thiamine biosynthesis adenylyltransferase